MAKFFGLFSDGIASYLDLVIDNDWKAEGSVVIKNTNKIVPLKTIPDDKRWQWKRGYECFCNGDSLRCAGQDVTFDDSRILWRKGWVAGLKEQVESVGGTIKCQ